VLVPIRLSFGGSLVLSFRRVSSFFAYSSVLSLV
jgi:hypothetical protein